MLPRSYLRALAWSAAVWLGLYIGFTWIVDPYGVSPVRISLRGVNEQKPKRNDIDRVIKPYEVWRYQPRTVFLGTSRVNQSMDPSVLDGTRFAPAYNASMPAGSMDMHAAYLRQYVQLDPHLRTVIVELFLPNFIGRPPGLTPGTWSEFAGNIVTLFASADTLWDSVYTLAYNVVSGRPIRRIERGGYLYFPNRGNPQTSFDAFAPYMWGAEAGNPDKATFDQAAFEAANDIIEIASAHDLELIFVLAPSHGYADYYYDAIGAWGVFEEWLSKLTPRAVVYSFSQPNDWVNEPISKEMMYWYDTFHFSLAMGGGMLATLAGRPAAGPPNNFAERITPSRVSSYIEERRRAVRSWARSNPSYVTQFEEARRAWIAPRRQRTPATADSASVTR
jgi:hypothetical protein